MVGRTSRRPAAAVRAELLESRVFLTGVPAGVMGPITGRYLGTSPVLPTSTAVSGKHAKHGHGGKRSTATPALSPALVAQPPFTPIQLRHFYGVDAISFGGIVGSGAGQTIALVDYNNQPNIKSDLATFDADFGLPAPPSFTVEGVSVATGVPTATAPPTSYDADDALEISLDVEYAHAFAPAANLLLIETSFNENVTDAQFMAAYIAQGVGLADATAGVSAVSMSYGVPDYSGESANDSYFTHAGITYLAAAGDDGVADTDYPSTSPNVVSVGGTQITTSDSLGSYGSEVAWNNSSDDDGATGGNVSANEAKPAYQSGVTQSATQRTAPDVALEASPDSGVQVYDSSQQQPGFQQIGGTSLSTPCWAGLVADADQGRALAGLSSLGGAAQTLPALYKLPSADFHDITSGNNTYRPFSRQAGNTAAVGYDLVSGLGTPVASLLVPALAGLSTVTGRAFQDNNANDVYDGTDVPLASQAVYLDVNNDGVREIGEPTTTTNSAGQYTFANVAPGVTGSVRLVTPPAGFVQVAAATYTGVANATSTANIALFPTLYIDGGAGRTYTLRASPTAATQLQVLVNGTVAYTAPVGLPPSLMFAFTGAGDGLAVDYGNGDPVPAGGVSVNGTAAANGDALAVLGTSGAETTDVRTGSVVFGSDTITYANVANLSVDPRTGTDALTVEANVGTVTVPAPAAGVGFVARTFSTLSVGAADRLAFATAAAHADRSVVVVTTPANLAVAATGQLDLGGNDMVVRGGSLSALTALAAAGYAGGTWAGLGGLGSSAAAADATRRTALGVAPNTADGVTPLVPAFDGQAVTAADVLVKYTYYGDADLSGTVDGADYGRADVGYLAGLTGWANGDFNYDATVDGSDYTLIDNGFDTQGPTL